MMKPADLEEAIKLRNMLDTLDADHVRLEQILTAMDEHTYETSQRRLRIEIVDNRCRTDTPLMAIPMDQAIGVLESVALGINATIERIIPRLRDLGVDYERPSKLAGA